MVFVIQFTLCVLVLKVNNQHVRTTEITATTPLQFNDAICKKICVAAISGFPDVFQNFEEKFVNEVQKAEVEDRVYDLSFQLKKYSNTLKGIKGLLVRIRTKTPCECREEFLKIKDCEDKIDEGYDFVLIRFEELDEQALQLALRPGITRTTLPRQFTTTSV